ncbi:MAG: transglutaminase family protein [Actinomycetota bacterium]
MESGSEFDVLLDRFTALIERGPHLPLDETVAVIGAALCPRDQVHVDEVLARLDRIAAEIPPSSLEDLVRVLFGPPRPFRGNRQDYYAPENSLLHRVLERRFGIPISLSIVTMEVGRRCGVQLSGVGMPAHFLVGVSPVNGLIPDRFVDPFHGGEILDAEQCRDLFHRVAGRHQPFDRRFLAVTPSLGIVERVLNNLKAIYERQRDAIALRSVMILRSRLPGIGAVEASERRRALAPFN